MTPLILKLFLRPTFPPTNVKADGHGLQASKILAVGLESFEITI
jgi:hypothetical protein